MPVATINSNGQITLPREVLERLNLQPGQSVHLDVQANGTIVISAPNLRSLDSLYGMLHQSGRPPVTIEEMDQAIAEGATRGERD